MSADGCGSVLIRWVAYLEVSQQSPVGCWARTQLGHSTHKLEGRFCSGACQCAYDRSNSQNGCHQCLWPQVKCGRLLLLKEILQDQKVGLTEAHIMSLLWPWVLKHVKFCGCPLRERTKINLFTIS